MTMHDTDRVSDRDRLERDEQGRTRSEGGMGNGGRRPPKKQRSGNFVRNIFILIVIAVIILMIAGLGKKPDMNNLFRTWSSTNEQGLAEMFNSVQELEDINKDLGEERGLHDRDRLYHDSYLEEMVAKEYLVYVFTGDEKKDKEFDKWVEENEETVQIFRIDIDDVSTNTEVMSYIVDEVEPMVLVYNEIDRGEKELEGVIKDPLLLDETKDYIDNLIDEKTTN